jgi:diaminopimelate epimerase
VTTSPMQVHFYKYEATGNDFVVVDNRKAGIRFSTPQIKRICDRRFGVGADGLMLIEEHPGLDFNLVYYNADGSQSLCGNGARAAVRMASALGLINGHAKFNAHDGRHDAEILDQGVVKLKMNDVGGARKLGEHWFINTGSPHFIKFVSSVAEYPVVAEGRQVRNDPAFAPGGTNANFVELLSGNTLFVRTYERGVEDETYSCGTGITAAALAAHFHGYRSPVRIKSLGGELVVEFKVSQTGRDEVNFHDIFLIGPAKMVFQGDLEI